MTVEITCPWCEDLVAVPESMLEHTLSCPACGISVDVAPDATTALAEAA